MLDIQFIRENADRVKKDTKNKNGDPRLVGQVLKLDLRRRALIKEIEELRAKRNEIAKIGKASEEGKKIKGELKAKEPELQKTEDEYKEVLNRIPNIVAEDVIVGKDESENKVLRKWGKLPKFDFEAKDHIALGEALGIIDTQTAAEVSGARFNYLKGDAVLLQNALYQLAISVLIDKGFVPVIPPLIVKAEVMKKMVRHDPVEERYYLEKDDAMLVGSAEHSLGPMYINKTLGAKDLPIRHFALTPAFRREAGSYGKDTKGILRQHQFDKIEMESFTTPEEGPKEQDFIVGIQEHLMEQLELPYQVVSICTGDMGGPDYRQIDIETWLPGQNKYRETHTSDYMTDYQARRLNTKVKTENGTEFVHMNDATAFAMGRTIIAILENYQQKDGSVLVPKVLQKWMGKERISAN